MSWKAGRPKAVCEAVQIAARTHNLAPERILARSHERQPVAARRDVATHLRGRGYSLPQIGRALGLHHSTVLHYLQTAPSFLDEWTGVDESGIWAI